MFDLSFFEIVVIGVVALIVIGPEKLPEVARNLGRLTGKVQRYISQVKEEVNREARFDELQSLQNEIAAGVNKAKAGLQTEVNQMQQEFQSVSNAVEDEASAVAVKLDQSAAKKRSSRKNKAAQATKGSRQKAVRK